MTLVSFLVACHKWVPLEPPLDQALADEQARVRVSTVLDSTMVFDTVWVAGDSVFGVSETDTVALAISDISHAEHREADVQNTGLLVTVGLAAAVLLFLYAGYCGGGDAGC